MLDRNGYVTHDGGVVPAPGVYLMGMQFLRRRKSALIDGAGDDARDLSAHLTAYLDNAARVSGSRARLSSPAEVKLDMRVQVKAGFTQV